MSATLTDFLLARIAEDEDRFRRARITSGAEGDAATFARRVLADCEAKRRIVKAWSPVFLAKTYDAYDIQARETSAHVFACLALPYADHPDYREEWRP